MRKTLPAILLLTASTTLAVFAGACGGKNKDTETAENASGESSSSEESTAAPASSDDTSASTASSDTAPASSAPSSGDKGDTGKSADATPSKGDSKGGDNSAQQFSFDDDAVSADPKEKVTPKFQIAPPPAGAPFTPDNVKLTIQTKAKAIHACYVATLKKNPKAAGKISVSITIDKKGGSTTAVGDDGVGDAKLAKCVTTALKGLKFPKPTTPPGAITYTYAFTPANG